MNIIFKVIFYLLSGLLLLAVMAYFFLFYGYGTDVTFQSSDGRWADKEAQFKKRDFDSILTGFILYSDCAGENVSLQRVTEKPKIYKPESWFNDYTEPKWKVPISPAFGETLKGPPDGFRWCNSSLSHEQVNKLKKEYYENNT